jgi:mono/diheme cytochrome c family protein
MKRALVPLAAALALLSGAAGAQQALTDQQKTGQRLATQHCGVCHFRIQINSTASYGPLLSKANFDNGREAELKGVIANGGPNMPGFKYLFEPAEIDAIVEFLKTVNPPGITGGAK